MKPGFTNDLNYGTCPTCKDWKPLTSFYHLDLKKARSERRKCCGKCNARHQAETDPFFHVKKAISLHRTICKEGDYSLAHMMELHRWQGFTCSYCNESIQYGFTLDHIVPQAAEGRNLLVNIALACLKCNSSKQDFEMAYWLNKKGFKVKPKILEKIRGAYHEHGFHFKGDCQLCKFDTTACHPTCGKYKLKI